MKTEIFYEEAKTSDVLKRVKRIDIRISDEEIRDEMTRGWTKNGPNIVEIEIYDETGKHCTFIIDPQIVNGRPAVNVVALTDGLPGGQVEKRCTGKWRKAGE